MTDGTTSDRSQHNDPFISREELLRVLHRSGFAEAEVKQALDALSFPARISEVADITARFGIYRDTITDRLGGSP